MKRPLTIVALTLGLAAASLAQTADPAKLKIKGVGLDATYAQVIKALGKPTKDGRPVHEECTGGREKQVEYGGLKLYFTDEGGGKVFKLDSFVVTSPVWVVSGARVGDTQAAIKARFGSNYGVDRRTDNGGLVWTYGIGDEGSTTFLFKGGKVTEISTAFLLC